MTRVVSIHHYRLRPGVSDRSFLQAVDQAQSAQLFDLPGLESFHFMKGIKGAAHGEWAAIWVYASLPAWEELWGPASDPKPKKQYPEQWRRWEDEMLSPLLTEDPDRIQFTSYEEAVNSCDAPEGRHD